MPMPQFGIGNDNPILTKAKKTKKVGKSDHQIGNLKKRDSDLNDKSHINRETDKSLN